MSTIVNNEFDRIFSQSKGHSLITSPEKVNKLMAENAVIKAIISKIIFQRYSKESLRTPPNLNDLLGEGALNTLRSKLQSDILLVVVNFDLSEALSHTISKAKVRLFDMHNGSLVFEVDRNINVNKIGEQGAVIAAVVLVGMACSDYETNFLKKLK